MASNRPSCAIASSSDSDPSCKVTQVYMGTSLIRNNAPLGPYSRTMRMALWWPERVLLVSTVAPGESVGVESSFVRDRLVFRLRPAV